MAEDTTSKTTDTPVAAATPQEQTAQDGAGATLVSTDIEDKAPLERLLPQAVTVPADDADDDDDEGDDDGGEQAAAGDDQADSDTDDSKTTRTKRRRSRAQDRVNDAIRAKYVTEAKNRELEAELLRLQQARERNAGEDHPEADASADKKPATAAAADKAPDQDDFATYEEYLDARADWRFEQRKDALREEILTDVRSTETNNAARARAEADTAAAASYMQKIDAARTQHDDWDEVIEESGEVPISAPMREALIETEHSGELLYYLAKNPQRCEEIASLSPAKAYLAMARLETQLTPDGAPPAADADAPAAARGSSPAVVATKQRRTRLPEPPRPVGTSPDAPAKKVDEMDYQSYKRMREEHERTAGA